MHDVTTLREGPEMERQKIEFDDIPVMPDTDIASMMRTVGSVCRILDVPREEAMAKMGTRLEGGVMPDISLAKLETIASLGNARLRVLIECEDGRSFNLALI